MQSGRLEAYPTFSCGVGFQPAMQSGRLEAYPTFSSAEAEGVALDDFSHQCRKPIVVAFEGGEDAEDADAGTVLALAPGQPVREEFAERHKDLKGSEAMVKNYFPAHHVKKWVLDLKQGRRIQGRAKFVYPATIETDKIGKKLIIPAVSGVYLVEKNLEQLAEIVVTLDRVLKDAKPQLNALARQRLALVDYQEDDGPTDFASAGLDAVAEILSPRSAMLHLDDGVTLADREATLREMNENFAREERDRQIIPATDGIEIADQQPESDESDAE